MSLTVDKLQSHTKTSFRKNRKSIKNNTARKMRRLGKRLGEDAPRRVITGYSD